MIILTASACDQPTFLHPCLFAPLSSSSVLAFVECAHVCRTAGESWRVTGRRPGVCRVLTAGVMAAPLSRGQQRTEDTHERRVGTIDGSAVTLWWDARKPPLRNEYSAHAIAMRRR